MTPAAIEPAAFRFVAQFLNHCATAVPPPPPPQKEQNKIINKMENFVIIKSTMNALMSVETFGHGANSGCYRK